ASGKSGLSIALAKEISAEIINADSMQLYRGMDIGTAKLTIVEREEIPHHLLDILDVTEDANVASYQQLARTKIDELQNAGKNVIIVGGTGLYIKAIIDELNFPDRDIQVRDRIDKEAIELGAIEMHKRLQLLDPIAAAKIPANNLRRVVRALEVIELTGAPFTAQLPREDVDHYQGVRQFGLVMDRSTLDQRISQRVDQMWELGFVAEVQQLISTGITSGKTAQAALGYKQIINALADGSSLELAKEETKRATRQYARRQETWFSRDSRIKWLAPESTSSQLEKILVLL
ncbi:MAG: tRNA (adenosine(37)-N6)-dimethylallyltransferase MiaA, partial [Actinobacteria bacterium]|nr:tRNA (adenosine(37)-N6)-dimethylallyltransferase MiaA [Actinomycetota bacterium]